MLCMTVVNTGMVDNIEQYVKSARTMYLKLQQRNLQRRDESLAFHVHRYFIIPINNGIAE